jgi:hypothetical protein
MLFPLFKNKLAIPSYYNSLYTWSNIYAISRIRSVLYTLGYACSSIEHVGQLVRRLIQYSTVQYRPCPYDVRGRYEWLLLPPAEDDVVLWVVPPRTPSAVMLYSACPDGSRGDLTNWQVRDCDCCDC